MPWPILKGGLQQFKLRRLAQVFLLSSPSSLCLIICSDLIFSTLEDLRSAFAAAKGDSDALFSPKRTLSIPTANVNIITFTCGDSYLFLGLENGFLAVYDATSLLTPGTNDITPLKTTQVQSSPLRQILPNPGAEPNLCEVVAVVGEGKVALINMQLETQACWAASDLMTQPVSGEFAGECLKVMTNIVA